MRKVISANFDTVKVKSAYVEAKSGCEDETKVRSKFPSARVQVFGTVKVIVRDRESTDPPALVKYVRLSGDHYTSAEAWKDAAKVVSGLLH